MNSLKHLGVDPDRLFSVPENQLILKAPEFSPLLILISAFFSSINFLVLILATIQSLSRTVGNVEFPIAASSGRQASLYNKSNASLWVTSTKQFRISFRKSSSTSEYTVLKDGVNLPVVVHLPLLVSIRRV